MEHPTVLVSPSDRPVIATADDALLAKQATVAAGYYADPFLKCFARNPVRMIQPIIKRGTHARVACIDRAVVAFTKLHTSSQVVVLGAGLDTTFLRTVAGLLDVPSIPVWFEVDHPSVVLSKAKTMTKYATKMKVTVEMNGVDCSVTSETSTCQCIGHDLRVPPSQLMETLTRKGLNIEIPTLFILECVQMYLPGKFVT
jgi:O-methyltransferase involved in polyketide biosynthesis